MRVMYPLVTERQQTLTGRVRIRLQRRWFRWSLPVPQVEVFEEWTVDHVDGKGPQARSRCSWRDLRIEDLPIGDVGIVR